MGCQQSLRNCTKVDHCTCLEAVGLHNQTSEQKPWLGPVLLSTERIGLPISVVLALIIPN
jgi:hypothetical protein